MFFFFPQRGLACAIYSDRDDCQRRSHEFDIAYETSTEVLPISGLWDFFNKCALTGCIGIILDDNFIIRFFNRLSDLDRSLPTIYFLKTPDAEASLSGVYFGKRGIIEIDNGRTIAWNNYEKSDKLCSKYLLFHEPLPGNQLCACTIGNKDNVTVMYQGGDTLLGPYITIDGAVPIFSDSTIASYFFKNSNENYFSDDFEIKPIKLITFLNYCNKVSPFTDIVLNPKYHRAFQGYFFKHDGKWVLHTVSGVWDINELEPKKLTDFSLPKIT